MSNDEFPKPIDPPDILQRLAEDAGGTIRECALLPDGSGFAVMSMPLPKDHWALADGHDVPPMPFRMGTGEHVAVAVFPNAGWPDRSVRLTRHEFAEKIREAGRYAYRASTMNGKEPDLDPDALLQNLIVGLLGYWTTTGLSSDAWENPSTDGTLVPSEPLQGFRELNVRAETNAEAAALVEHIRVLYTALSDAMNALAPFAACVHDDGLDAPYPWDEGDMANALHEAKKVADALAQILKDEN